LLLAIVLICSSGGPIVAIPNSYTLTIDFKLLQEDELYRQKLKTYSPNEIPAVEIVELIREMQRGYYINGQTIGDKKFLKNVDQTQPGNLIAQEQIDQEALIKEKQEIIEQRFAEIGVSDENLRNFLIGIITQGEHNVTHMPSRIALGLYMTTLGGFTLPGEQYEDGQLVNCKADGENQIVLETLKSYLASGNDPTLQQQNFIVTAKQRVTVDKKFDRYTVEHIDMQIEFAKDDPNNQKFLQYFAKQAFDKMLLKQDCYSHEQQALTIVFQEDQAIAKQWLKVIEEKWLTADNIRSLIEKQLASNADLTEFERQAMGLIGEEQRKSVIISMAKEAVKLYKENKNLANYHVEALAVVSKDTNSAQAIVDESAIRFFLEKQLIAQSNGQPLNSIEQQIISLISEEQRTKRLKELVDILFVKYFIRGSYLDSEILDHYVEALKSIKDTSILVDSIKQASAKAQKSNQLEPISTESASKLATELVAAQHVKQGIIRYLAGQIVQQHHIAAFQQVEHSYLLNNLLTHDTVCQFMAKRNLATQSTEFETQFISYLDPQVMRLYDKLQTLAVIINPLNDKLNTLKATLEKLPTSKATLDEQQKLKASLNDEIQKLEATLNDKIQELNSSFTPAEKTLLRERIAQQFFAKDILTKNPLELAVLAEKPSADLPSVLELIYAYTPNSKSIYHRTINELILDYNQSFYEDDSALELGQSKTHLLDKIKFYSWLDEHDLLPPDEQALQQQYFFGNELSAVNRQKLVRYQQQYGQLYQKLTRAIIQDNDDSLNHKATQQELLSLNKNYGLEHTSLLVLPTTAGILEQTINATLKVANSLPIKPQIDEINKANEVLHHLKYHPLDAQGVCSWAYKDLGRTFTNLVNSGKGKNILSGSKIYSNVLNNFNAQIGLQGNVRANAVVSLLDCQSGLLGMMRDKYANVFKDKDGHEVHMQQDTFLPSNSTAWYNENGFLVIDAKMSCKILKTSKVGEVFPVASMTMKAVAKIKVIKEGDSCKFVLDSVQENILTNVPLNSVGIHFDASFTNYHIECSLTLTKRAQGLIPNIKQHQTQPKAKLFTDEVLPLLQGMAQVLETHPGRQISWLRFRNTARRSYNNLMKTRESLFKAYEQHLYKALDRKETPAVDDGNALVQLLQQDGIRPRLLNKLLDNPAYLLRACDWINQASATEPMLAVKFLDSLLNDSATKSYLIKQGALSKGITGLRYKDIYNDPVASLIKQALTTRDEAYVEQHNAQPGAKLLDRILAIPAVAAKLSGEDWVALVKQDSNIIQVLSKNNRYLRNLSGNDIAQLASSSEAMRNKLQEKYRWNNSLANKLLNTTSLKGMLELYVAQPDYVKGLLISSKVEQAFWQRQPILHELKNFFANAWPNDLKTLVNKLAESSQQEQAKATSLLDMALKDKHFVKIFLEQVEIKSLSALAVKNDKLLTTLMDYPAKFHQVITNDITQLMSFLPSHYQSESNSALAERLFGNPVFMQELIINMTVTQFYELVSSHPSFMQAIATNAKLCAGVAKRVIELEMELANQSESKVTFKSNDKEYDFTYAQLGTLFKGNETDLLKFAEKFGVKELKQKIAQAKSDNPMQQESSPVAQQEYRATRAH
jgi:hypothetical protein